MRSDADKWVNVEVAMQEKSVGWSPRDLADNMQAKAPTNGDAMDVDKEKQSSVPTTPTFAPGMTIQPKHTINVKSMTFSQGRHKLPNGSFKHAQKGYKEVHVPEQKQKPPVVCGKGTCSHFETTPLDSGSVHFSQPELHPK